MSGGVLAYADRAAAERAADAHDGEVVGAFEKLVVWKGDAK
jgi:hypothetical protein